MEENNVLTEQDFEKMKNNGVSQAEIDNLKYALDLADLSSQLPKDTDAFIKKVNDYFPDDPAQTLSMYFELSQKDPEFFKQLVAFQEFVGTVDDETSIAEVLRQIREAKTTDEKASLELALKKALATATAEKKEEISAEVKSLSIQDKQQLAELLKRK